MGNSCCKGPNLVDQNEVIFCGITSEVIGFSNHKHKPITHKYQTEGYPDRVVTLYHVTSPEAATSISRSKKMLRGSSGMFGGGIYFAESEDIANNKAHHRGATIIADVKLGRSLILPKTKILTYTKLNHKYGCSSVKGVSPAVSKVEYVVYNYSDVRVRQIFIGGRSVYKNSIMRCHNTRCAEYNQWHSEGCFTSRNYIPIVNFRTTTFILEKKNSEIQQKENFQVVKAKFRAAKAEFHAVKLKFQAVTARVKAYLERKIGRPLKDARRTIFMKLKEFFHSFRQRGLN